MEQLAYDTTISEGFFSPPATQSTLSQHEVAQLMQQFMSSIDLHKLAAVFFQQLQSKLNIAAVKIQFASGSLTLGDADKSCNIKTLDFVSQHASFATINYAFSRVLNMRDTAVLQELHRHFKQPLKNALDFHQLKQMAMKDHLTSLGNRASYQESLHRLISQAKRQAFDFGVLVIDMDKFKRINDTFGHHEGDNVLMAMADVLQQCLRDTDYAFRFGGDEFCCLLPGSTPQMNQVIAERIQQAMQHNKILAKHGVSCSIGSANHLKGDDEQSLFHRADKALYDAKHAGRSCIKVA